MARFSLSLVSYTHTGKTAETELPNYLSDLNGMHEAEKRLTTTKQQNTYQANIAEICYADQERANNQVVFNQLTATAAQRAEAFLRTLNLWDNTK